VLIFPISTDVHDGRVRLAAIEIAAACLLMHLWVSVDTRQANARIDEAVQEHEQNLRQTERSPESLEELDEMLAELAEGRDASSKASAELEEQIRKISRSSLLFRLGFTPARFNLFGLLTYMFVHTGWMHLLGNLIFFYVCGVAMEKYWGFWRFVVVYFACGVFSALFFMGTAVMAGARMIK